MWHVENYFSQSTVNSLNAINTQLDIFKTCQWVMDFQFFKKQNKVILLVQACLYPQQKK